MLRGTNGINGIKVQEHCTIKGINSNILAQEYDSIIV